MESKEKVNYLSCWPPPKSPEACHVSEGTENGDETGTVESTCTSENKVVEKCSTFNEENKRKRRLEAGCEPCEYVADVALARWWRRGRGRRNVCPTMNAEQNLSPHTLLAKVSRLPEAQAYLKDEIERLEQCLLNGEQLSLEVLGSFYERVGQYSKAYQYLLSAVKEGAGSSVKWMLERVLRQMRLESEQACAVSLLKSPPLQVPVPREVERRSGDSLSYREFILQYALTKTPLVITGLGANLCQVPWSLEHIREMAGHISVTTKRYVPGSAEWAQLEEGPVMTVDSFIDTIVNPTPGQEKLYLFDWSLPLYCPELAQELTIPKYFAGDLLQHSVDGSLYRDSWPSLFIAPQGLSSQLHVDAFGSNFWMALFKGKKRWTFYPSSDAPFLYPRYHHSLDPVFEADPTDPDLHTHPLLSLTTPLEVTLQEGEILFVPAGCPHRVENLTDSIAISANYVDLTNLELVKQELKAQAWTDPRALDLLTQLENLNKPFLEMDIEHLHFKDFKRYREVKQ